MSEERLGVVIYHIGLPKTGTTFLQADYFPKLQGSYHFVRKEDFNDFHEFVRYARGLDDLVSAPSDVILAKKVLIYSAEEISVSWLRIRQEGYSYPDFQPADINTVAGRVRAFHRAKFGDGVEARLLVGFRDLKPFLPSWYAQSCPRHFPAKGPKTFDRLLDYVEEHPELFIRSRIQPALQRHFDVVFTYEQHELLASLERINGWFQEVGLDSSGTSIQVRNQRKFGESYKRQYNPQNGFTRSLGAILPRSAKRKLREIFLSDRIQRLLTSRFEISDRQRQRLEALSSNLQ